MKKILLIVALIATVFTTASAQMEYGNVTTALTSAKTWDFSKPIDGLTGNSSLTEACTIDNLYFGCTADNYIYFQWSDDNPSACRLHLCSNANLTFLGDDSDDGVIALKVPAGKGVLTISGKTAAKKRAAGVFVGGKDGLQADTIHGTDAKDWTYNIDVAEETSIYITGIKDDSYFGQGLGFGKRPGNSKGLYITKIEWAPDEGGTTGISSVKSVEGRVKNQNADEGYYTLTGARVTRPQKGIFIHSGRKIIIK